MWNKPTEEELSSMPALYSTQNIPLKEKMIHMHFFLSGSDFYAAEYDPQSQIFFGFVILNEDYDNAEWGCFSFKELCEIRVECFEIERDLHFTPTRARDIEKIRKAEGW